MTADRRDIPPMSPERAARYSAGDYTWPLTFDDFPAEYCAWILRGWTPEGTGVGFPELERQRREAEEFLK